MTHEYDEMLDAATQKLFDTGDIQSADRYFIENLADHAAKQVELDVEEMQAGQYVPTPAQSEVTVDATDYVQAALIDYEDGTHVNPDPAGAGLVRVNVKTPAVFVVDAKGNRIEGGRVMVTYSTIELDTP